MDARRPTTSAVAAAPAPNASELRMASHGGTNSTLPRRTVDRAR